MLVYRSVPNKPHETPSQTKNPPHPFRKCHGNSFRHLRLCGRFIGILMVHYNPYPIPSMCGIFTYIWLISMLNVGIHGWYGYMTWVDLGHFVPPGKKKTKTTNQSWPDLFRTLRFVRNEKTTLREIHTTFVLDKVYQGNPFSPWRGHKKLPKINP